MNTIQQLIQTHLTKYPLMELTDAVKLLYQNGLGPGHMVTDEAGSLKRLCEKRERPLRAGKSADNGKPSLPLRSPSGTGL